MVGPAPGQRHDDLPGAGRRRPRHDDPGGAVPRAAGAVPRGRRVLRPDDPARRAEHPLDRHRGRRGRDQRRVRRGASRRSRAPVDEPDDEEHGSDHRDARTRRDDERPRRDPRGAARRAAPGPGGGADGRRPAARRRAPWPPRSATRSPRCVEALAALADGVRRVGPRLRAAQRRRRLALLHPRGLRARGGAVRARRASRRG